MVIRRIREAIDPDRKVKIIVTHHRNGGCYVTVRDVRTDEFVCVRVVPRFRDVAEIEAWAQHYFNVAEVVDNAMED